MNMNIEEIKPTIGLIMGDPAGIGPEIVLKSLVVPDIPEICNPVVIGNYDLLKQCAKIFTPNLVLVKYEGNTKEETNGIKVINVESNDGIIESGRISASAGRMSYKSIKVTFELLKQGQLDGASMAPLTKESLERSGLGYHSEFDLFADLAGVDTDIVRVMQTDKNGSIFAAVVAGHVPFREIVNNLSASSIIKTAEALYETMCKVGIKRPRLAVAALNPHGGEGGLLGDEEDKIIRPAIRILIERNMDVKGPIPADTVFVSAKKGSFNGLVYLYHDQGHIAMKTAFFGELVSIYAGIPYVILSPAHGSALEIAGQGIADAANMILVIRTTVSIIKQTQKKKSATF